MAILLLSRLILLLGSAFLLLGSASGAPAPQLAAERHDWGPTSTLTTSSVPAMGLETAVVTALYQTMVNNSLSSTSSSINFSMVHGESSSGVLYQTILPTTQYSQTSIEPAAPVKTAHEVGHLTEEENAEYLRRVKKEGKQKAEVWKEQQLKKKQWYHNGGVSSGPDGEVEDNEVAVDESEEGKRHHRHHDQQDNGGD